MIKFESKGFSLIELAIVLAVLGLFVGGAIGAYSRWVEKSLYEQAAEEIELAKKAVLGFAITNGWLPCSDISTNAMLGDGIENRVANDCATNAALGVGQYRTLPYADLGLPALDPWGSPYRYHAARNYTGNGLGAVPLFTLTTGIGGGLGNTLTINDGMVGNNIADQVAFVIYSVGPDRGLVETLEQADNRESGPVAPTDYDDIFSSSPTYLPYNDQGTVATNDDTGFDDIISWVSTHVLKLYMVEAEALP